MENRLKVECDNLLHVTKLIIKELIDTTVSHSTNRALPESHPLITRFLIAMENVFCHGLKSRASKGLPLFGPSVNLPDPWPVIELSLKKKGHRVPLDCLESVSSMVEIKSGLGKLRAWLRIVLMQKRMSDYFHVIVDQKESPFMKELYEPDAVLIQEEGGVIAGLLVGLSVLDCNFHIKENIKQFDEPLGVINYSSYMKKAYEDGINELALTDRDSNEELENLCDQKNYLEELNEHLKSNVESLQKKLTSMEKAAQEAKSELAIANNSILSLQENMEILSAEKESVMVEFERHKKNVELDLQTERDTYETSRQGLDVINADLQKRMKEEIQLRLEAEKALEKEIRIKTDGEVSSHRVSKELHEKQEIITKLRAQIDEIKNLNLDLSAKAKSSTEALDHKTMLVNRLEDKCKGMSEIMDQMEIRISTLQSDKFAAEETARKLGQQMALLDTKCAEKDTDLRIQCELKTSLQQQLEKMSIENSSLEKRIEQLRVTERECERLRDEVSRLNRVCCDQENALSEMASQIAISKLETEGLKEVHASLREAQWTDDKEVSDCRQCNKGFNVSRRKHHCRNCGGIFCHDCSNNKMPLASSAKPVRVCDACHNRLLDRYSQISSS